MDGEATDDLSVVSVSIVIYDDALKTWNGVAFTTPYTRVDATLATPSAASTDWDYSFTAPTPGSYIFSALAIDSDDQLDPIADWFQFTVL